MFKNTSVRRSFHYEPEKQCGLINPADRTFLHKNPGSRIAEINLAYTADLIVLDGLHCFVSGGPAHGVKANPGVIIAGGDRVAVDAVGVSVLKYLKAEGVSQLKIEDHEQLSRAAEIGVGNLTAESIQVRTSNLTADDSFNELTAFVKNQL